MMVPCSSGRCVLRTDLVHKACTLPVSVRTGVLLLVLCLPAATASAAQAVGSDPPSPPPEAEAADQDLTRRKSADRWLDEAIFTEISPLTIPEIGIVLPPDQEG